MKTREIKEFYENRVGSSGHSYEYDRWFKTSQRRASYVATKSALKRFALPLVSEGDSILEVGPGPGTWTKEILSNLKSVNYDIVDISEEMLKQARENLKNDSRVNFIQSDILDFEPQKQYNFFFSSRFIEYVPQKERVIEIISKSLKSGSWGYIVTKTPQYNRVFSKKNHSPVHQGQISAHDLKFLFEEYGFEVKKVVNVTSVFPLIHSGIMDRILTFLSRIVPFRVSSIFSESYGLIFVKR